MLLSAIQFQHIMVKLASYTIYHNVCDNNNMVDANIQRLGVGLLVNSMHMEANSSIL